MNFFDFFLDILMKRNWFYSDFDSNTGVDLPHTLFQCKALLKENCPVPNFDQPLSNENYSLWCANLVQSGWILTDHSPRAIDRLKEAHAEAISAYKKHAVTYKMNEAFQKN
jgi:hypothetical protein